MLKFLTHAISRALGFSKVEARGSLMLIFVILIGITFAKIYVHSIKNPTPYDGTNDAKKLQEWIAELDSAVERKPEASSLSSPSFETKEPVRASRPSSAPKATTISAGYSRSNRTAENESPIVVADINHATAEDLQVAKGIGPVFSQRIVAYRQQLGGFASNEQLNEVYNLEEETIQELLTHFEVQSTPAPIDINADSAKLLAGHPYITYDLAWVIINYRRQNGDITSAEDLKKIKAIDHETFLRLKPYLD